LSVSQKTHPGILPQFQVMEITAADKPRVGTKLAVIESLVLSTG
jgi:hypothetical protein